MITHNFRSNASQSLIQVCKIGLITPCSPYAGALLTQLMMVGKAQVNQRHLGIDGTTFIKAISN